MCIGSMMCVVGCVHGGCALERFVHWLWLSVGGVLEWFPGAMGYGFGF